VQGRAGLSRLLPRRRGRVSSGDDSRATWVATRLRADCSSASFRARASEAASPAVFSAFAITVAMSSVESASRTSVFSGSGSRPGERTAIAPQRRPSTSDRACDRRTHARFPHKNGGFWQACTRRAGQAVRSARPRRAPQCPCRAASASRSPTDRRSHPTSGGSRLMGLKDCVAALGGTLEVVNPPVRRDSTRHRDPARHRFRSAQNGIPVAGLRRGSPYAQARRCVTLTGDHLQAACSSSANEPSSRRRRKAVRSKACTRRGEIFRSAAVCSAVRSSPAMP
jgi:hypothetical protein